MALFFFDTLRFFGFGPSLINWVRTFYCNIESCVLNNGWSSNFFQPSSPFPIFVYSAAEVLAKTVRNNKSIRGLSLGNDEVKISQYADDTVSSIYGVTRGTFFQGIE